MREKPPRLPKVTDPEFLRYTGNVVLFSDRLRAMSDNIRSRCEEIFTEFGEMHDRQLINMASRYRKLSEFTELLANSVDRNMAEVSETSVTFGRPGPIQPLLRKHLTDGMDKFLIREIKEIIGNHYDGDAANFLKQVELYTAKVRNVYHIEDRDQSGPSQDGMTR